MENFPTPHFHYISESHILPKKIDINNLIFKTLPIYPESTNWLGFSREPYFKELVHTIVKLEKSVEQVDRLETWERVDAAAEAQNQFEAEFLHSWETSGLLLRPNADWMRSIHFTEGNLFYSESAI